MIRQFKRSVRALTDSSYPLSRSLYLSSLWVRSFGHRDGRRPVVVYQVGKVGSTTVTRALDRVGIPTYHVHHLRPEFLGEYARQRRTGTSVNHRDESRWIWEGEFLARRLPRPGRRWDVVTLVRDPVARDISDFFQNLHDTVPADILTAARASDEGLRRLYECWEQRWVVPGAVLDAPGWFDREFREVLGVDLLELPFPRDEGWAVYDEPKARILAIRMEDLSDRGSAALSAFRGVAVTISSANTRDDSADAELYGRFIAGLELPRDYLDRSYGSRYARHFYDGAQLAAFRSRWRPA
jgi:hypothetical protein